MASKQSGESKQGLIIALVFCSLLIIVLGVVSYYGYAGQAALEDAKKKADADTAAAKKHAEYEHFKALLFKVYSGNGDAKKDAEDLAVLRDRFDKNEFSAEPDNAEIGNIVKNTLDKNLGWDPAQKKPLSTYAEQVSKLSAELEKAYQDRARTQAREKQTKDEFDSMQASKDEQVNKIRDELAKAQKANVSLQDQKSKEYLEALDRISKQEQEIENFKKKVADMTDDANKMKKKLEGDIAALDLSRQKIEAKVPAMNMLDYDKPKGKIVSLDRSGTLAYVNLGSADNVRPQLTFSIVGADVSGKAKKEPKGSLEIADVISDHLSRARITREVDPNRNPVLRGDLLYNPAWSPNLRDHVAIAGLIDLTGDGRDSTPEFVRNLERMGMVVDAYLDLKDRTVKGPGMGFQTNYLIVGEIPQFTTEQSLKEGDVRVEGKKEVIDKVTEMQDQAKRYGTTIIPLRRFVALVGYPVPKSVLTAPPAEADFNLYRRGTTNGSKENGKETKPMSEDEKAAPKDDKPAKEEKGK